MMIIIQGQLEIDTERGVVYFNSNTECILRICRLGKIPTDVKQIDVTHMHGVSFIEKEGEQRV